MYCIPPTSSLGEDDVHETFAMNYSASSDSNSWYHPLGEKLDTKTYTKHNVGAGLIQMVKLVTGNAAGSQLVTFGTRTF